MFWVSPRNVAFTKSSGLSIRLTNLGKGPIIIIITVNKLETSLLLMLTTFIIPVSRNKYFDTFE